MSGVVRFDADSDIAVFDLRAFLDEGLERFRDRLPDLL
jgi:hypothetical protein